MAVPSSTKALPILGRYVLHGEIASGGMATVHFGRLRGAAGFARSVAIKRLHPQFAKDPEFVAMFVDEARLAARIAHPNVVPTLDVVSQGDELLLVMEYVRGASLSRLLRVLAQRDERVPPRIATSIISGVLHGLHAAHEAKSETGARLDIVHRDVSPQNVLVGTDGIARLLDFGVAKATGRWQSTRDGQLKGKIAYMGPEQITTGTVTRKTDLYAAAVVLWETLTGRRLFRADNEGTLLAMVLGGEVPPPSTIVEALPPGFDPIVLKGLQRDPEQRFATAREMAAEVEKVVGAASHTEVGEWVERVAIDELRDRANRIGEIERTSPLSDTPSRGSTAQVRMIAVDASSSKAHNTAETDTAQLLGSASVTVRESTSQVSHLAMVQNEPPADRARRRTFGIAAAAAALVVCAIGATILAVRPSRPVPPPATSYAAGPPTTAVVTMTTATGTTATGTWTPVPSAAPPLAPTPSSAPIMPPVRTSRGYGRQSGGLGRTDCTPPYTTDAKGHVHFKPSCLN